MTWPLETVRGEPGTWAHELLGAGGLAAPHHMPVEVANILRRAVLAGDLSADSAALAHADLVALRVDLYPYAPFAERVWELRGNIAAYDAWYVAVAEALGARLGTLDARLSRSPGPRCGFAVPEETGARAR
jgi:predicted nucleic acid-binding protein